MDEAVDESDASAGSEANGPDIEGQPQSPYDNSTWTSSFDLLGQQPTLLSALASELNAPLQAIDEQIGGLKRAGDAGNAALEYLLAKGVGLGPAGEIKLLSTAASLYLAGQNAKTPAGYAYQLGKDAASSYVASEASYMAYGGLVAVGVAGPWAIGAAIVVYGGTDYLTGEALDHAVVSAVEIAFKPLPGVIPFFGPPYQHRIPGEL